MEYEYIFDFPHAQFKLSQRRHKAFSSVTFIRLNRGEMKGGNTEAETIQLGWGQESSSDRLFVETYICA